MTTHRTTHRVLLRQRRHGRVWHAATWLSQLLLGLLSATALTALVAGVPYALWHWLGWPLPHSVPTSSQIEVALTGPFTDRALLDVLGCLCWITWTVFVIDVVRATPDTFHRPTTRHRDGPGRGAPMRALASVLLGAIVTMLVNLRPHAALATIPTSTATPARGNATALQLKSTEPDRAPLTTANDRAGAPDQLRVIVEQPRNGVHDSLWRIADRYLGDGNRWPEIYQLNENRPQADGGALTVPSLVQPGWLLDMPGPAAHQPTPRRSPASPARPVTWPRSAPPTTPSSPTAPTSPSASPRPTSPAPTTASPASRHTRHTGIDLGDGVSVSLGVAAAISAALVVVRRRDRRWYTPGSGRRDDLPVAPVVRSLHLAHLRATTPPEDAADSATEEEAGDETAGGDAEDHDAACGVVTAQEAGPRLSNVNRVSSAGSLFDLATHGVGVVGVGAADAVRAALLDLLSDAGALATDVVMQTTDLETLLGGRAAMAGAPRRLHVVADLATALDQLEAATLHRTRQPKKPPRPIVLIASPGADTARLQAVLDNGAPHNVRAILLGQWRAATSLYVRPDGVVSASHGPNVTLQGTRLFVLPAAPAVTLLNLLHDGERLPDVPPAPGAAQEVDADRRTLGQDVGVDVAVDIDSTEHGPSRKLTPIEPRPVRAPVVQAAPPEASVQREAGTEVSADMETLPTTALTLRILGPLSLTWMTAHDARAPVEIIGAVSPRLRELLVLLALHPDGISRDRVADTLWPDAPPTRPHNNLTTSLSRLRSGLFSASDGHVSEVVLTAGDQLRLDPALMWVDYRDFSDAATNRRAATTDADRPQAWRRMIRSYGGDLADGLGAEWLETPREAIRRDAIDAATRLARAVVATDPQQTLDLLETARARDPYNEQLYRDIMRVQRRLGHADAIERTLALLATRLGELDEAPSRDTVELAAALLRPATRGAGGAVAAVAQ